MTDNVTYFDLSKNANICTSTDVDIDAELNEMTYHLLLITGIMHPATLIYKKALKIGALVDLSEAVLKLFYLR